VLWSSVTVPLFSSFVTNDKLALSLVRSESDGLGPTTMTG
jgi:hypothetical protein